MYYFRLILILIILFSVNGIKAQVDDPDIVVPSVQPGNPTEDEKLAAQYFQNKEFEKAGGAAHKLASPCRHIGAEKLLSVLKDIETEPDPLKHEKELNTKAEEALQLFHKVKQKILEHIDQKKN